MVTTLVAFCTGAVLGAMFPVHTLWIFKKVKEFALAVKAWFTKPAPTENQ